MEQRYCPEHAGSCPGCQQTGPTAPPHSASMHTIAQLPSPSPAPTQPHLRLQQQSSIHQSDPNLIAALPPTSRAGPPPAPPLIPADIDQRGSSASSTPERVRRPAPSAPPPPTSARERCSSTSSQDKSSVGLVGHS